MTSHQSQKHTVIGAGTGFRELWSLAALLFTLLILSNPLYRQPVQAVGYTACGELSYQLLVREPNGSHPKPLIRHFETRVSDSSWQVQVILDGNTNFEYILYSYASNNISYYARSPFKPALKSRDGRTVATNTFESVLVECQPVPRTWTSAGGEFVWLALASAAYFAGVTNSRVLDFQTIDAPRTLSSRHDTLCEFTLSTAPPHLPLSATFWGEKAMLFKRNDGALTATIHPHFSETRYISAAYTVDRTTNVDGLLFPKTFTYNAFSPVRGSNGPSSPFLTVQGTIAGVSIGEPALSPELPTGMVVVRDLRVPEPYVHYCVSNGILPALDSREVVIARTNAQLLAARIKAADAASSTVYRHRRYFVCVFFLLQLPAIVFLARRMLSRKPKTSIIL
jgi:hypothetical protein